MSDANRLVIDRRTDCSVVCIWCTPCISTTRTKAVYSPYFEVREGVDCRLVVFPDRKSVRPGSLVIDIEVISPRSTKFDCFMYCKVSVPNHIDASWSMHLGSTGRFTAKRKARNLCVLTTTPTEAKFPCLTVLDPKVGFTSSGSLTITADLRVLDESTSFTPENSESKSASSGLSSSGPGSSVYSGKFTWTVKNFSLFRDVIRTCKLESPCFPAGECDLQISVYQSVVDKVEYLGLCLESKSANLIDDLFFPFNESKDANKMISLVSGSCWCLFKMSVLNNKSRSMSIHSEGHSRFSRIPNTEDNTSSTCYNCGDVSNFMRSENGYLVDDTAVFIVSFEAIRESYWCGVIPRSPVTSNPALPKKRDCYPEGFSWKIENFSRLKDLLKKRKITGLAVKSKVFRIGNQDVHMVVYPRGNSQLPSHLSFFLEVIGRRDILVFDWSCFVSYRLSVVNHKTKEKSVCKDSVDRFSNATKEFGWSEFMTVNSLLDKDAGFLVGDTISFLAEILVLKDTFLLGKAELRNSGFPVDLSGEGEFFLWKMDNFSYFEEILETKKVSSRTFQVGDCELQIELCKSMDSICAFLESGPSVLNDPDKNLWVSYRMALVNQKNFAKSMWKESSFCTKSTSNSGIQFMKVSDMLDPDAGYFVHQSIAFCCQIVDHCPLFDFAEPGVSASDDSQNLLPNDPDELSYAKCSEVSRERSHSSCNEVISENEDDIFHSMIPGAGIDIDISLGGCSQRIVTNRIGMDVDWICSTMNKLCVYLGETITTKEFLSEVKNLVNSDIMRGPYQMNWWTLIKTSQQGIIDLLLDIVVECCNHQETSSSVNCNDTSSAPSSLANGVLSRTGSSRKNGLENYCESSTTEILASCFDGSSDMRAVECLDNRRPDISGEAVLEPRPLEQVAKSLLKFTYVTSVQELNIKWPEQSKELLAMIINSLEALDVTLPQGFSKPKQWPVSVQKISHVLGIAPKNLQLDLVMLVPKLLDHSEHPQAALALIHQLFKADGGPELQGQVFHAINQLDFSSEVWEDLFFLTSKLVIGLSDGALTSCLGFLIKTASHCHQISRAVRVIRAKLCSLGIEVSPCVLNFLRETISKFGDIAEALLRDIDVSFELEEMCLARSGGSFLYEEDELSSTRLNETHVELLHEARHFSDVYILVELLSVNSLTTEAHQVFERAVARRSIVVRSIVTVLERKWALRLNVGPTSFAGNNQQSEEMVDANNESSPVEPNDFPFVLGLAEMFFLSSDSGVRQFAQMLYSTLFRLFGDENYQKRMLKGLVDHAISHIENGHTEGIHFDTLLLLVNEEQGLAGPVLNMMRELVKATIATCQNLRNQLRAREDHNLHTEEEKLVEHADMVRQNTRLLERLSESEDSCNYFKSELKLEKDNFARERKELTTRLQEVASQLEWFRSEQNGEIATLSTETKVFKDRVKTLETQFSQLKTRSSDDLKRLVKEKCTLAENLKIAEAARKRSEEESISYARKMRILEDDRHSLLDEVRQLKATVGQLERGKLDNEGNTKQGEMYIGGREANDSDSQGLLKRFEEELKSYAKMSQILEDDGHSLQDEVRQLKVTVGQLEQGKLDNEEKIYQCEKYIGEMEAKYSACQIRTQEV